MKHIVFRLLPGAAAAAAWVLSAAGAAAGELDERGELVPDPKATAFVDFESEPERYLPADAGVSCTPPAFTLVSSEDALSGKGFVNVNAPDGCAERFVVPLPKKKGSYRASVWVRHGRAISNFVVLYPEDSGLTQVSAPLAPTGRATSDGWVEMASNELSVDGELATATYLRVIDFADTAGLDVDSLEVVPAGAFEPQQTCSGALDPVCGPEGLCVHGQCAIQRLAVPPLPDEAVRDKVVDALSARLRIFFGGARSRKENLPAALATVETMRKAETAWQFWGALSRAVRQLADWHTNMGLPIGGSPSRRLNACFIEGDADASHAVWPKHPLYPDVLVSHAGSMGAAGLKAGDRLVAIDGQHPIAWARSLAAVNPGHHVATDPSVFADLVEGLGGPAFGHALILRFAKSFTVIRCDGATGECAGSIETVQVSSLTEGTGGQGSSVRCDNRPSYHFAPANNPPPNHAVDYGFFSGPIQDTAAEEAIYGVVWDTLYGGGNPNGYVNGNLKSLMSLWKEKARGVILDHRAGNGGTLDAPELLTTLVRPPKVMAVALMPLITAGYDGPADAAEGLSLFDTFKSQAAYEVGSGGHDPDLPVALLLHRDGSASDYLPLGMKGAPKVRLFAPHPTAGAFSTFVNMSYSGSFEIQMASGDTISFDGKAWIGSGVPPDEVVAQKQSDILAGRDSVHEAALAWIRANLKPVTP